LAILIYLRERFTLWW